MHQIRRLMNQKERNKQQYRKLARVLVGHIRKLKYSHSKPMETLAKTLQAWLEAIGCMWRFTKNNGITEGFHRK
ncbi:transposase [Rubritalea spongiae]|uniref:transposase n=1 Tax=Rubritalea spongiae TaxID=430797 RepID=UPI003A96D80B